MIQLTVNGQPVEVETGSTILDAIRIAGFNVPTLCYHPKLVPYGSCRLCLVEVEGARTLQPSCVVPAANGMVVHTDTDRTKSSRKFILSMIFSERNHFCMYCQDTDGDCDLQQAAYAENMTHWPITPAYKPFIVDASHPDFILDNNRCILCRRCVRACTELVGNATLGFEERGSGSLLIADNNVPLGESTCISCGNCVQFCPTGALFDRRSAYQGRETDLTHVNSVCMDCSLGCERVVKTRDNRLVRIDGNPDAGFNESLLCYDGRYKPVAENRKRITSPMVRRNGQLESITWDEALSAISVQFKAHDSKEISAHISPRQPIEALSAFHEFFADHFQVGQVTLLGHDQTARTSAKLAAEIGAFESGLSALKDCDAAIILGTDMVKDHQVAGFFLKRQAMHDLKMFIANSTHTKVGDWSSNKLEYIGSDYAAVVDLLRSFAHKEEADLSAQLQNLGLNPERAEKVLGNLKENQKLVIVVGNEFTKAENLPAFRSLVLLAREIGAKVVTLKGKGNNFAGALFGYEMDAQAKSAPVFFLALGDGHACDHTRDALAGSEFKIVQASYESAFTEMADIVLPCTIWDEQAGYYLNSDGKLGLNQQAVQAADGNRSVLDVLKVLASKSGLTLSETWRTTVAEKLATIVLS